MNSLFCNWSTLHESRSAKPVRERDQGEPSVPSSKLTDRHPWLFEVERELVQDVEDIPNVEGASRCKPCLDK